MCYSFLQNELVWTGFEFCDQGDLEDKLFYFQLSITTGLLLETKVLYSITRLLICIRWFRGINIIVKKDFSRETKKKLHKSNKIKRKTKRTSCQNKNIRNRTTYHRYFLDSNQISKNIWLIEIGKKWHFKAHLFCRGCLFYLPSMQFYW